MDTVGLYKPIEKAAFLVDAAGGFSEQEIRLVQAACPELASVSPHDPAWRRSARPWGQDSRSEMRRAHSRVPGWQEILTSLYSFLGRPVDSLDSLLSEYGPCGGDGYGNTHVLPPGPSMVDYLVALLPKLEAQAREIYRHEVLEELRRHSDLPKPEQTIKREEVVVGVSFGGFGAEGAFGELIRCVLCYEERWRPPSYNGLLRMMRAGYGKVGEAMMRPDLTFDQVRAILVSFTRFASRQSANPAYLTSGKLQRLLERLRELREAEECPLLRLRKGGMEDGNS